MKEASSCKREKVPMAYFSEQYDIPGFTNEDIINLHLTAEPHNRFIEVRGKGKVPFSQFVVPYNKP